jgi:hypothetical protein
VKSTEAALAKLREAYVHARRAQRAIERARKTTESDLREAFLMDAQDNSEKAMTAIAAAGQLLK